MKDNESTNQIDYSSIEGVIFKTEDLLIWDMKRFDEWFVFLDFFFDDYGRMIPGLESVIMLEEYAKAGSSCAEFVHRIGIYTVDGKMEQKKINHYRLRLSTMVRKIKSYLTSTNPKALSPLTAKRCRFKMQYEWMREVYDDDGNVKFKEQPNSPTDVVVVAENTQVAPANIRLINAIDRVISVYEALADSITAKEIRAMSAKDRISALQKLSYIHTNGKIKVPTKIRDTDISKASADDLEKELLNVNEDSDDE